MAHRASICILEHRLLGLLPPLSLWFFLKLHPLASFQCAIPFAVNEKDLLCRFNLINWWGAVRYIPVLGQRSASFVCTRFHKNNYTNDLCTHYLIYLISLSGCFELHSLMIHPSPCPNPITSLTRLLSAMSFAHGWKSGSGSWKYNRGQRSSDITEAVVSISIPFFPPHYFWPCTYGKKKLGIFSGKVVSGEI